MKKAVAINILRPRRARRGFMPAPFRAILHVVTLQTRRQTYWILFGISAAMLLVSAVFALLLALRKDVPIFLIEHGIYKVHVVLGLRISSLALSLADVLILELFAVVVGAFILTTFRKTVSAEIFFFAFWLSSLSFESFRLIHLFLAINGDSDSILAIVDKLYMGVKFIGYMAIFISGLYAAGMRNERQFSIMAVCVGISIALASTLPINTGIWTQNIMFQVGYGSLIEGFSLAIILITIANYLIAVRVRGDKAYYFITLGIAAIAIGALFAGMDGSPLLSFLSVSAMGLGSALYIFKLHSFYLWQ